MRFLRWIWHETIGHHDWRCVGQKWTAGQRVVTMVCDGCGAGFTSPALRSLGDPPL